ncbi:MAG: MobC family plasmid mobilization relaxosome protein [Coriobacteriia bacterium]|nr:MobC family plasmid mobilization relaxosome protein [Coriobacteriia bacterium]
MASLLSIHIRFPHANKGGTLMRTRNEQVNLRLSLKELRRLDTLARRCNLTRSAYLRHLINGMVPKEVPPTDYYRMMREIHYVGNNLNQLAHRVHCTGEMDAVRIEAAIKELRQAIQDITNEIIKPDKLTIRHSGLDPESREMLDDDSEHWEFE